MKKLIIFEITAGFTDQITILCTALKIKQLYNAIIKLDVSWFHDNKYDELNNEERKLRIIDLFYDLNLDIATQEEINLAKQTLYIDGRNKNIDLNGLLQSTNVSILYINTFVTHCKIVDNINNIDVNMILDIDKYLFKYLSNENKNIINDMIQYDSVALHIRRGDYIYFLNHNRENSIFSLDKLSLSIYYLIYILKNQNIKFYIFSNNYDYVITNIVPIINNYKLEYKIIQDNEEYIDFYLITKCKYTISTFGKFAKTAFLFNKNVDKILIDTHKTNFLSLQPYNYIDDIIIENFNNYLKPKYEKFIVTSGFNKQSFISSNVMIYILDFIHKNRYKNICQLGMLDGFETHSILKYAMGMNKDLKLNCFENNEIEISGYESVLFTESEKKRLNLFMHNNIVDTNNIYNLKDIDLIFITKENSHPIVMFYLLYLFSHMNKKITIILNGLSCEDSFSINDYIYNLYNGEKNRFYDIDKCEYSNIGFIKISKDNLLKIIKNVSNISFNYQNNIFFYNQIVDIRKDYYNYFNIDKAYERLYKLKEYMANKFKKEDIDYIINNIKNNIDNKNFLYSNNIDYRINNSKALYLQNNKINDIYNELNELKIIYNIILNKIAWWIPIRKWRDSFRAKFKIEDQTRPDQTRPDQTRPDLIFILYIFIFIIIQKIKNYNLCCKIVMQHRFFVAIIK
ncbi:putative alpha-1,2-fucosyltransferase; glycosyl transferase, family 11 [Brachyspira suanatina]|uniref:Putative alpha-1,2-fucosyltransferase glycosyl transferase, family 11 n=1 Tax=Brachyspira suanatina TaxID=381802 RepID=A0A0G4KAW6_9SPIR|nr:hypothetical protein [Brachyspira suanatina]CRF35680.1 putative alpha-1,2-fucosyltransferase; glycosyl transferase, family 11 [Brachyspira suanatina]